MTRIRLLVILLLFGFASAFAQERQQAPVEKTQAETVLLDPKMSPEEQALIMSAGEDNPARIDEASMIDPKLNPEDLPTEADYGVANAKPDEEQLIDKKLENEALQPEQTSSAVPATDVTPVSTQPEGDKEGTIVNYRDLPGGTNEQAPGEVPENITNYRDIQGPNEQPQGDQPE